MRPLVLQLQGFTAFRRRAEIDFRGRSLFAITGPTGAGKSSLLDAMTWALYGAVPRVGRSTKQLITHGEKSLRVQLDFAARGRTYRVVRATSITGGGEARLEELADDGTTWRSLADRAGEVTARVSTILGLDYETFTKTVILPQGEFASFLREDESKRRKILSSLLGLETYADVGRAARQRARSARDGVTMLNAQIERLTLAMPETMTALEAERVALEEQGTALERQRERLAALELLAATHLETGRDLARANEAASTVALALGEATAERDRALARGIAAGEAITRLSAERTALGYDPEAHERMRRAFELLEVRAAAERALADTRAGLEISTRGAEAASRAAVDAEREARRAAEARGAAASARRSATDAVAAAAGRAHAVTVQVGERAATAVLRVAEAQDARGALDRRLASLQELHTRASAMEQDRNAAAAALTVADTAMAEAHAQQASMQAAVEDATARARDCRTALDAAIAQDAAAALRAGLQPGDLCPVCGEPITALSHEADTPDLDAARAALAATEEVLRSATQAQQIALAAASATNARLEETRAALKRVEVKSSAFTTEVAAELAGTDLDAAASPPGALAGLIAATEAAVAPAEASVKRTRADATALLEARQALEGLSAHATAALTLEGVEVALLEPLADETDDVLGQVEEAAATIEATLAARQAAATADSELAEVARRAEDAARATEQASGLATAQRASAEGAVHAAEARLASIEDPAQNAATHGQTAAQLRTALLEADQHAEQTRVLDGRIQEATTAAAVLAQQAEDRAAQVAQLTAEAEGVQSTLAEASTVAAAATSAFEQEWRALLGETNPVDAQQLVGLRGQVEDRARAHSHQLGAVATRIEQARAEGAQAATLRDEIEGLERVARTAGSLEQELQADRFIAYVQREALAALAVDASARLLHLTGQRYRLVADDAEFWVIDQLNGDERRSVKTLSGGETFMASLALALALSERLPELAGNGGAIALESLFLDEGFGTLDAESLDVAIEGLERLAGGQRMIGVISHVPEIAERLPDRIDVLKAPDSSRIAGVAAVPPDPAPVLHLV